MARADKTRCGWCGTDPSTSRTTTPSGASRSTTTGASSSSLLLEGTQAGLSWLTILRKRDAYRRAFDGFDPEKVARYDARRVRQLLRDPGIVRNRLKVESAVKNARAFLAVPREFGSFAAYQWRFVDGRPIVNRFRTIKNIPPRTPLSDAISKDLRQRGFSFVGSTIVDAHLQAVGVVNDHLLACVRHRALAGFTFPFPPLGERARVRGKNPRVNLDETQHIPV